MRILLAGFGGVGRAFAQLVGERGDAIRSRYGLELTLSAVATSVATWFPAAPTALVAAARSRAGISDFPGRHEPWDGATAIEQVEADLLVEATSGDLESGEPAVTHVERALSRGMHVVAASKGAFLRRYPELRALADRHRVRLGIGAAAGAALPTLDLARCGLAGSEILGIEGILNGTSNYVLTRMDDGLEFAAALREAQELGVAEPDPRADVEGLDTASKLVLLGNVLVEADLTIDDIAVSGITVLTPGDLRRAAAEGRTLRLLGTLVRNDRGWRGEVRPTPLPSDHPLAGVRGLEKGVSFRTDTMDRVTVIGGRSDPLGAAAALLRDIVNLSAPHLDR